MDLVRIRRDGIASPADLTLREPANSAIASTVQMYERHGYVEPWIGYLASEEGCWVGTCAFASPPVDGTVEIAYFTFPEFEGRGVATRMAQRLVAMARDFDPSARIIAHTLTEENASTTILRKLGFVLTGTVDHPEDGPIWEWRLE